MSGVCYFVARISGGCKFELKNFKCYEYLQNFIILFKNLLREVKFCYYVMKVGMYGDKLTKIIKRYIVVLNPFKYQVTLNEKE